MPRNFGIFELCSLGLLVMSLAAGCDSVKAPHGGHVDQLPAGQYPNVVIESKDLQKGLVFGRAVMDRSTPDKPMRITQPARNTASYPINVQYRFEFLDATGRPIKSNIRGWNYMRMPSRQEVFFEGAALDTDGHDWRLIVQSAK
jgi:uncharacterized protein YcfL